MALLIVVLRCMVKGIRLGLTPMLHNRSSIEVGRDAECAASSAFAVRAVADAMHRGQRVDSDGDKRIRIAAHLLLARAQASEARIRRAPKKSKLRSSKLGSSLPC